MSLITAQEHLTLCPLNRVLELGTVERMCDIHAEHTRNGHQQRVTAAGIVPISNRNASDCGFHLVVLLRGQMITVPFDFGESWISISQAVRGRVNTLHALIYPYAEGGNFPVL